MFLASLHTFISYKMGFQKKACAPSYIKAGFLKNSPRILRVDIHAS